MFIHNGKLFLQIVRVAMGNPLGSRLANWFLGMIEKKIFDQHLSFYPSGVMRTMCLLSSIPQPKLNCF